MKSTAAFLALISFVTAMPAFERPTDVTNKYPGARCPQPRQYLGLHRLEFLWQLRLVPRQQRTMRELLPRPFQRRHLLHWT
ncbi:hypothetical protein R3P38DRAFT_2882078 [Favolaschia claudopus]|uniref:Uncharacterized protein n=1 Tax=Favolaschia claudopus TaxID=2862362 RepID=A0AAW0D2S8_9AGAR